MKSIIFALTLATVLILSVGAGAASNYEYRVLHNFTGPPDGATPNGNLIMDKAGNLYGTTVYGGLGEFGDGTVFKLAPNPDGTWTETVLHSFTGGDDGHGGGGLIFDKAGNLYGTSGGGAYNDGVVFKLTPNPDGTWTETVLYNFPSTGPEGAGPGGIIFDAAGNLYGTTGEGGSFFESLGYLGGTAFKLTPNPVGLWNETVVHDFCSLSNGSADDCPDGHGPTGVLVFDKAGNLYGTTRNGGYGGIGAEGGTVLRLTPNPDGTWTESVLYSFTPGADGEDPQGGVIFDQAGNLYGTTILGGDTTKCLPVSGCGVLFQLKPQAGGA